MTTSESPTASAGVTDPTIEIVPFPDAVIDLTRREGAPPTIDLTAGRHTDMPSGSGPEAGDVAQRRSGGSADARPPRSAERATRPSLHVASPGDDEVALRSISVVSRVLFVAMIGVMVAALIAVTSVWAVWAATSSTDDVSALSDAKRVNGDAIAELRALEASTSTDAVAHAENAVELSARVDALIRSELGSKASARAVAAQNAYLDARRVGTTADTRPLFESAVLERSQLGARINDRQVSLVDHILQIRRIAIILVLALLTIGAVAIVLLARRVGRSIADPVRLLGRHMRRFGDGDTSVRSPIADDEVGTLARSFNAMADQVGARVRLLHDDAERGTKLRVINDALDQADHESDVHHIVEGALAILTPDSGGELLLNDSTSSTLWTVATNPDAGPGGCPVETSASCLAMRRAQPMIFDSPTAINACPKLRGRPNGPCSAACVPVSVNGNLLGVFHVTAKEHEPPSADTIEQLVTLAGQVGNRIGAMRTLESTRLQASTDGLTGLANRRMLEARLGDLLRTHTPFVLAVADLDKFKELNDQYGHEFGDRALQLFAKVLEDNVRGHDIVARFGGEEFVLVYPEMSVKPSMEVIERIRAALARSLDTANFPSFTCSFGVAHSSVDDNVEGIIRVADAGLLMAKELGRNRVVYADEDMAATVFGGNPAPRGVGAEPTGAEPTGAEPAGAEPAGEPGAGPTTAA